MVEYLIFYFKSSFWLTLFETDKKIAQLIKISGCFKCKGKLDVSNYPRKPRGVPEKYECLCNVRFSFCCRTEGCRKRITPPSVRFLGQRVYIAIYIIIISSFGMNIFPETLSSSKTFSEITYKRWISWWNYVIPNSSVWKEISSSLSPNTNQQLLPLFLIEEFREDNKNIKDAEYILKLLKFISPISEPYKYPPGYG